MRVEPFGVGSVVHVVKRGARGLPITRDDLDKRRFARLLYYLNDEYQSEFWELDVKNLRGFQWPIGWPKHQPIVKVLAWTLMSNHFHLLLQEIQDGGVSRFLQRVCGSMTRHFNEKYGEQGSIFQGAYRSRTIDSDRYLRWAMSYVLVKNVFELYPSGYKNAVRHFDKAWEWGMNEYRYSSLKNFRSFPDTVILGDGPAGGLFKSESAFKKCSRDMIYGRLPTLREAIIFE